MCREVGAGRVAACLAFAEGQLGLLGRVLLKGGDCLWLDRLSLRGKTTRTTKHKMNGFWIIPWAEATEI